MEFKKKFADIVLLTFCGINDSTPGFETNYMKCFAKIVID